jgi:hypothetical protein
MMNRHPNFVKIKAVKNMLHEMTYMIHYPYFPDVLSDFSEMRCKRSAHVDAECRFCGENRHSEGCSFLYWGK